MPANGNSRVLTSIVMARPILTSIDENIDETRKEREGFEAVNFGKLVDLNQAAGVCLRVGFTHKSSFPVRGDYAVRGYEGHTSFQSIWS